MDDSLGFLISNAFIWIVWFSIAMLFLQPIQAGKELRKNKYLYLAETELVGHPPFYIKPLTEKQKGSIEKRFRDWKTLNISMMVTVWVITLLLYVTMWTRTDKIYYLVAVPEVIFTDIWARLIRTRYQKALNEMDSLGVLEAKIIDRYIRKLPSGRGYRTVRVHYVVSAYRDEGGMIHCFDSRNEIPSYESSDHIECLMYNGQFAGYGAGEGPVTRVTK